MYSLRKSKRLFFLYLKRYKKKQGELTPRFKEELEATFKDLQGALLEKKENEASLLAKTLEHQGKLHLQKTIFEKTLELATALIFALVIAVLIRQSWFEFYEIPTGSMRPTFKEKDLVVVSKCQFGINIPLTTKHLAFDPANVKRGGIVVFTGADMDIQDVDTKYFYLFPGKKQYIKRLIAKPGDTLYFYGGKIYALDSTLNDISLEIQPPILDKIDHVPFISFEGRAITPKISSSKMCPTTLIYQMNLPVAKMEVGPQHKILSQMLPIPSAPEESCIKHFGDLWGFKNYAFARLITKKEAQKVLDLPTFASLKPAEYYLELIHNPNLKEAYLQRDIYGKVRPMIGKSESYIPLTKNHMETLFAHLYTARFIVDEEGYASRYGYQKMQYPKQYLPKLEGVPAGTYEFYYGKAYQIHSFGIKSELSSDHPLCRFSEEKVYQLFNMGIEFDNRFLQASGYHMLLPSRYAYFKQGSLVVMGSVLMKQEDEILKQFVSHELLREKTSVTSGGGYVAFVDHGSPTHRDGSVDKEKILRYGLRVPKSHYLVLGDNYAMSADSRDFGFVPENNLRGVPEFIFWPFGKDFGSPLQTPYVLVTLPRIIIWILFGLAGIAEFLFYERKHRLPVQIP